MGEAKPSLVDQVREQDQPVSAYVRGLRETVIQMMHDRAASILKDGDARGEIDPFQQSLRGILRRIEEVETIYKAFSVQLLPGAAPSDEARAAAAEELLKAVEALFSLELEARASQLRFAASATLLEYGGVSGRKSQSMNLVVDRYLGDRFRRLLSRVRNERLRQLGRSEPLDAAGLVNLLVAMGEVNVSTLVHLGCPVVSATGGLAALVAERKLNGPRR